MNWVKRVLKKHHSWVYRNPYDRRCSVCNRHEVSHCFPDNWNASWWEVFNDGDITKHGAKP